MEHTGFNLQQLYIEYKALGLSEGTSCDKISVYIDRLCNLHTMLDSILRELKSSGLSEEQAEFFTPEIVWRQMKIQSND